MKQTNKIKAFLTVLATTTALSSGFAVTWGTDGKIQISPAEMDAIQNEYKNFKGGISGFNYFLSHFKGELEQKLGTGLSHDDFASILDNLGYGADHSSQEYKKRNEFPDSVVKRY